MIKLKNLKLKRNYEIFNISSNQPIKLSKIVNLILTKLSNKPKIINRGFQIGDIYKTNGDNKKIIKLTNVKFTGFLTALEKTLEWNKKYLKLS